MPDLSIDHVHEDVEFVHASERGLHDFPERHDETGRGEGALATRQT